MFDKQGSEWRKKGYISPEHKAKLEEMVASFEDRFKSVYTGKSSEEMRDNKVLRKEMLEIVRLVHEDKFELNSILEVYQNVERLFNYNEEYFHILPQLYIQHFWNCSFGKKQPVL
jgi:uncharacterized protein (UPF0335 family)